MQNSINISLLFIAFLLQFHMKASYLVTLSCFMNKMKPSKCCSKANLDGHPTVWCGSLVDLAWLIMVGTTSWTNFSNSPKVKLVRNLIKPSVACMISRTLTLGLTDCPLSSSNSADVKYSLMLTQVIATCTPIRWASAISSSNSLSLLEELESRCHKMNSIGGKWNEPLKKKNEMGLPKPWKHSNHLTLPTKMENLKLSREMRLKKEKAKWDLPNYITSRALNEKLRNPINPKL